MGATYILKTRVTPETKARVVQVVQGEFLTEAVWLRRLVAKALHDWQLSSPHSSELMERCSDAAGVGG